MHKELKRVSRLISRINADCMGIPFVYRVDRDKIDGERKGRIFIQVIYIAPCTKTGKDQMWRGGKLYLSDHMTDDEIIKKAWVAFESAVKHEVMEGFRVDGKILFNPHVNFEELLKVSDNEVTREDVSDFEKAVDGAMERSVKDERGKIPHYGT